MSQIQFNGKTYNDIAEMPATEREMYEQLMSIMVDEDDNGVPDVFEGDVVSNIINVMKKSGYGNNEGTLALEQMPPAMRARLSKGIAKLYEFGLISGVPELSPDTPVSTLQNSEIRPSKPIIPPPSAIQEDTGPRLGVILLVVLALAICAFGVAAYYLSL